MFRASLRKAAFAVALLSTVAACAPVDPIVVSSVPPPFDPMTTVVKVIAGGGHGSGVYIGGGIIITAAHVTTNGVASVKFEDGTEEKATLLWQNTDYDVAAVKIEKHSRAAAIIDCTRQPMGEAITAIGSPGVMDFVALRGYLAGKVRPMAPKWKEVLVADISGAGGLSGGPVFGEMDTVIGIVVGGMLAQLDRGDQSYDLSQTGLMMVVPGSTICMLLGRE